MYDETEDARRARQAELNSNAAARLELTGLYGKVWDTQELREDFEVLSFLAPFVVARDRKSGNKGTLEFQHSPRFYFNWLED